MINILRMIIASFTIVPFMLCFAFVFWLMKDDVDREITIGSIKDIYSFKN